MRERLKKEHELNNPANAKQNVTISPSTLTQAKQQEQTTSSQITIPGVTQQTLENATKKKPMIIEVLSKDTPDTVIEQDDKILTIVFNVEQEESARDIEFDVAETEVKLKS